MTRDPMDRAAQGVALALTVALCIVLCVRPAWPLALALCFAVALVGLLRGLARRDLGAEVDAMREVAEDAKKTASKALEAVHAVRRPQGPGF